MAAVNVGEADELTSRLIDRAAELVGEHGPAGLSLRKLAALADTSTMAVYTRFGDKQQLVAAMRREGFRRLGERLAAVPAGGLVDVGRAYRRAALDSPHLYGLMFGPLPPDVALSPEDDDAAAATFTTLVGAVQLAVDDGVFVGDAQQIALQLWVVAHGMVSLELAGMLPCADPGAAYDDALQLAAQPFLSGESGD